MTYSSNSMSKVGIKKFRQPFPPEAATGGVL